jgi:NAD(P)H-hydrate epimerase
VKHLKVLNSQEAQQLDEKTQNQYGISTQILMEIAGLKCAQAISEIFPDIKNKKVAVFVGPGNNGGDGLVLARHLFNQGVAIRVFLLGQKEKLKTLSKKNLQILENMKVIATQINSSEQLKILKPDIRAADIIVDAIFGVGLKRQVEGLYEETIETINYLNIPVVSIDIPSGLDSDRGISLGACICADYTITLGLPKVGLLIYPGAGYAGQLSLVDIGFPKELTTSNELKTNLITPEEAFSLLPERRPDAHKGDCGKVFVIAGSTGLTGAAVLTCLGALKIGAGLVKLGVPSTLNPIMEVKLTEVMTEPLPEKGKGYLGPEAHEKVMELIKESDVVAIGPGLGKNPETKELIERIIKESEVPLVIDADGLNLISSDISLLKSANTQIVLTPHPGEMGRLIDKTSREVQENRIDFSKNLAYQLQVIVVLKGARTIIADPEGQVFINITGNSAMATGGTGDVLTGMIAGLIAQGQTPLNSSILGVYLHGLTGDLVFQEKGTLSLIASDLLEKLPLAISSLGKISEKFWHRQLI